MSGGRIANVVVAVVVGTVSGIYIFTPVIDYMKEETRKGRERQAKVFSKEEWYETNRKQRSTPLGVDGTASHPESRRIIQEVEGHASASQQGQDQQLQSQPAAAAPAPVSVAAGARVPDVVPAALAETEAAAMASTSAR